ncbi:MAG TPA: glycosyltransferase [Myxococcota bacterium]|nr:glycosyltransferase [Myxococcota bacterium]
MSRPRILVLTKTTALGGAERLLMNALPHLDRERFDYRLAAFDDSGPLALAWREQGLPVETMPAGHKSRPGPRTLLALRRTLTRERIDLVHAHLPVPGALARVATRGLPTRLVYTEHNTLDMYRPATRWLNSATYGWQNAVVAVSERVRESAVRHVGRRALGRSQVIANGIEPDELDRAAAHAPDPAPPAFSSDAFRVLVPATLERRKGQDILIEAVAALAEPGPPSRVPPAHVWLAGEGVLRGRLEAQARRLGVAERIHFLGQRSDVFALMRCADLVALPSRFEGHPLALLEAMALGKAVAVSAVGGVPETVRDGETGLLVPRGDVRALAHALERLRADRALRMRLGSAAAREVRARYHVRSTVAALEEVYRRCLDLGNA